MLPLDAIIIEWAAREPDRPLIATAERPAPVTARELKELAGAAARTLALWGIGPGDRVAVWGENTLAWAVWLCAAAWRGAAVVALHPALEAEDLADALRRSRSHWLVVDEAVRGRRLGNIAADVQREMRREPDNVLRGVSMVPDDNGDPDILRLVCGGLSAPEPAGRLDLPLNIQFTSGSTGAPKAVVLSQRALILNARRTAAAAGIDGRDRIVSPLPLYHAAGLSSGLILSLVTGALWCTSRRFTPKASLKQIETHSATVFQGVPTMFSGLLAAVAAQPGSATSLRLGFIGGAPCPPDLCRRAVDILGLERMTIVYGQTEFGPTISLTSGAEPDDLALTSVGAPLPGTDVRIVDPVLGSDSETGEIWVRGETKMEGYFGDPDATAAAVVEDGWLRTGDLGSIDRGNLKITGRLKELIIRGGENVSPTEVEDVLRGAPGVRDVVVVPVPSDHWGEEICAVILPTRKGRIDTGRLSEFCESRLARYKRPDHYILRDEIPTLPSGKIDRVAIRRAVAADEW